MSRLKLGMTAAVLLMLPLTLLAADNGKLEVAIGASISAAKVTKNHNITLDDLKDRKAEYTIKAGGQEHKITLTKDQIKDILAGTTVHVDAANNQKVRITLKSEKPKSSGW